MTNTITSPPLARPALYLASASPRRRELLAQIGLDCIQLPMDIDESVQVDENPADYVLRLAAAKAQAGWQHLLANALPQRPLLAADTTVTVDGEILGKPADAAEARAMLARLSGRSHEVLTGVAVCQGDSVQTALSVSRVELLPLSTAMIDGYIASGEPFDKAGAYGIQGRAAMFIAHLDGSYSGVMGLPLCETARLLAMHGLDGLGSKDTHHEQ
ncbi:septum formation inhibitor Maf [Aquaspirillum sp. LM1]|uniref:Maf family protein n=1 Tax=Aquaspirillum sp. LM1 TaxID=1938604 RepID=UPI000983B342|nr:Maf family protein [Aquaspirillum sp. LM1]AQR66016.1 septum formation inhibitor Maf [Aquaspirillum sp. LM1]